ncbi:MAG: CD225/dispanin family protein, partial [Rikenellaceae bacterium]
TPATMVWYESLESWQEAHTIEELKPYFEELNAKREQTPPPYVAPVVENLYTNYTNTANNSGETTRPMRPKNWLIESIIVTLLCCIVFGLVGIFYSIRGNDFWDCGQYDKARQAYRTAGRWVIAGVILASIAVIICIISMLFPFIISIPFLMTML